AAAVPVRAGLDREHHPRLDRPAARLVGVRRLVRAGADAVADRVRRLARVAGLRETVADQPVELGEARAGAGEVDGPAVHVEELVEQPLVLGRQLARADVLRVVGPVAVGADPDLEQRRLVRLHGTVAGRGERTDPRPRPDEREAERELDVVALRSLAVDVAEPERGRVAL